MNSDCCIERNRAFTFDTASGEITINGHIERLEPRTASVLEVLIAHRGHVVSRDELFRTVWPNRYVVDEALTRCISQIRRAFGDTPPHSYIETLHKRGYRLVAPPCTGEPV